MSQLIVRKKGVPDSERQMTVKSFEAAASRRGWEIVSRVANEKSEIQKLMDQKRAEKAAQEQGPAETPAAVQPAKRGPKPKSVENEA